MDELFKKIEDVPSEFYYAGVLGSILLSIGLHFAGKKHEAIFVGLWAPTIFNLGLFTKLVGVKGDGKAKSD